MATEAYISDHISPLKVKVEDNQLYSESSKVVPEELIKVESSFIQPLETKKAVEENITDLGDVYLVNEGFVKAFEGENFLKSPQVAEEKVEKMDEDQLVSNKKLNGSDVVGKIEMDTDENIVLDSNFDQRTRPVSESTVEEDDNQNKTVEEESFHEVEDFEICKEESNQEVKSIEVIDLNEKNGVAEEKSSSNDSNATSPLVEEEQMISEKKIQVPKLDIKDEEFEDSEARNKGEKIEEGLKDETLIDHTKEDNSEVLASCTQETETAAEICKEEELEVLSTKKDPGNEIKNDSEKSEDVSSLAFQEPPEEIYEDKLENAKHSVEDANIEPPTATEALDGTSIQNVQGIAETTTIPIVEDTCEKEIEKIIREVPEELSETFAQSADASENSEITPQTLQAEESGEKNGLSVNETITEDGIVEVESSYAETESKDQKFEEIHETATSETAEEKENVSENNDTETLELATTTDSCGIEEIKEIQVPITGQIPTEAEQELPSPVDKIEAEIVDEAEKEHIKPEADEVKEEKNSELVSEPKIQCVEDALETELSSTVEESNPNETAALNNVPRESPEAINEAEKESEIVPDQDIAVTSEFIDRSFEEALEMNTKPISVTSEEYKLREENKKASETIEEEIIGLEEISALEPTPTGGEIQADEEREEAESAIDAEDNEQPLSTGEIEGHEESSSALSSEKQDETEEFLVSQTKCESDILGVEDVHETETAVAVERTHANNEEEKTKEALETKTGSKCHDEKINDHENLSNQGFPPESIEGAEDGVEETEITPTASEATNCEEIKLDDEAVKSFDMSSDSKTSETIETVDTCEHDSEVENIKPADASLEESKLAEDVNKIEAGESETLESATTTDSRGVEEIKEIQVPITGQIPTEEERELHSPVHETGNKVDEIEAEVTEKVEKEHVKPEADEVREEIFPELTSEPKVQCVEDAFETELSSTAELNNVPQELPEAINEAEKESDIVPDQDITETNEFSERSFEEVHELKTKPTTITTEEYKMEEDNNEAKASEIIEEPKVIGHEEISDIEPTSSGGEIKADEEREAVEAATDGETNEQPLSTGEFEEHQQSFYTLLSEKQDETDESLVSQTKTESNILSIGDVHETETTAAVEKTHANNEEEKTKEALETTPVSKCHDGKINDQSFPIESIEGAEEKNGPSENKTTIEDGIVDAETESKDQKFEEIHKTATSETAEEKENVSENNDTETLESATTTDSCGVEEIKEIQVPITGHIPTEEEKELPSPVPETGNFVDKIEAEIVNEAEKEHIKPEADEVKEEKNSGLASEPKIQSVEDALETELSSTVEESSPNEIAELNKVHQELPEAINEAEKESEIVPDQDIAATSEFIDRSFEEALEMNTKPSSVTSEEYKLGEENKKSSEPIEEPEIIDVEEISVLKPTPTSGEIHTDEEREEAEAAIDAEANEQPLSTGEIEGHKESPTALSSETQDETEEFLVSQTKRESDILGVEDVHETETAVAVEKTHANNEEETTKEALETTPESKCHDGKINDHEILSSQGFPLENIEGAEDGVEETEITPTASEATNCDEIKLGDEAVKIFDMRSDSKTSETIETVDTCEQDSEVENIKPADASLEESKLAEDVNKIEAGESETLESAITTDSRGVEEIKEIQVPITGQIPTEEERELLSPVHETGNKVDKIEAVIGKFEKEHVKPEADELREENFSELTSEPKVQCVEDAFETELSSTAELNNVPRDIAETNEFSERSFEEVHELKTKPTTITTEEYKMEEDNNEAKASETIEEPKVIGHEEISDIEPTSAGGEIKADEEREAVEAATDGETNEQPLSTGEFEEHQQSFSTLLSEKQDEPEESLVSQTKTESNILSIGEVHETETTAAVERTHANNEEEKTKEALESTSVSKCHDGKINDQSFPIESIEGAEDRVEETKITPTTTSEASNSEEIKLNDEAVKSFDMRSDSKTSETIETCEQDSEVENIKPEDASVEESKLEEDANKIDAGESVTAEKTEGDDVEAEDLVLGSESESLKVEEIQEVNDKTTMKPTEDDSSKLQETSGMLSQLQNIDTGEESIANEIKAEEVKGSDAVGESKDCVEEIHENETTPVAEISEENVEEKTECHEGNDIAVTTGTEVTILGESKLKKPIDAFGTSSETTTPETIETIDVPKHVSKADDIKLEEASGMVSQVLARENEAVLESSELPATESDSFITEASEIEKAAREVTEVINQTDILVSQLRNIETVEESDVDVIKSEEATGSDEVCEPREHLEEISEIKVSPNEDISGVDEKEKEIESVVEQASGIESKLPGHENESGACESTTSEKNNVENVEPENSEVPGAESESLVHNVSAVSEDEVNEQPRSIDEFEERQKSSALLSEKQDETEETLVSQTKTEFDVLGVEEVNETETTTAVEKTHANNEEEKTNEVLEKTPKSEGQDENIVDQEILSSQSFPLECGKGAEDGAEETEIMPTASEVTNSEEIKLNDEAVGNFDVHSDSKTSETIKAAYTCEQDSKVENIKPVEASVEESKLAEDVNKIEAGENVIAEKTEANDIETENQKVIDAESESLEVEETQEANASPAETASTESEKVMQEVPKPLPESISQGPESDGTNEIALSQMSQTENIKEEDRDLSSNFLSSEESQENETPTIEPTEDDGSKLQETSGIFSQFENIETGEASIADEVMAEEINGSDAVCESKYCVGEIHETETTPPPAEISKENIEEKMECHEVNDIAEMTGTEVAMLGENKLINEPIDAFGTSSETIETVDALKHVSKVDDIKLEEASSMESQLTAHENEAEAESSDLPATESESLVHNVEEVHETDTSPVVGDTDTSEIVKEVREVPEVINQAGTVVSESKNIETKEESNVDVVLVEATGSDEVCEPREHLEEIGETKASPNEEISGAVEREKAIESMVEQASSIESQLPANTSEAEDCECTTAEKNSVENVEVENEVPEEEPVPLVHNVAADTDDVANKQPLSTGEFEEQESSTTLSSKKQDETGEFLVSQTKTESTVLGVEEVHETETAAVEKTYTNKEDETTEALETTPESKGQDVKIMDQEILSNQSFPLESVEGANDGAEETDTTPTTACEATTRDEIKLNDEAVENLDMCSDSKNSESIEAVDTCEQDSEDEKINSAEASIEESKLAEDVNKIEADESVTAAKSEADDVEVEDQKVPCAESESLEVEKIQEASASPSETRTTGSEKVNQEVPNPLPGGISQGPESDGTNETAPSKTSQTENIKEEAQDLSSNFLSSEESQENETTTIEPTEDDGLKLQETSGMLSQPQNMETGEESVAKEIEAEEVKGSDAAYESKDCLEEFHETMITPTAEIFEENVEEKKECHEGTEIAVMTGTDITTLGESKLINESFQAFGSSTETTTTETIETVDAPKHVSKVDDIKLEEESIMESQLPSHEEEEVESSELPVTESKPSVHNVEEIHETDTSPVVRDTETSEIEKVVGEVSEVINHEDTVVSQLQNIETAEESVINVVKAEEATGFDEICEPKEHIEEIRETKAGPNEEISGVKEGEEETESVVDKISAPTNPDVEAVIHEINEQPLPTCGIEEPNESSSVVLSELDKTKESEVSETNIESNALETTAISEKTHADKVEEVSKEDLEKMSELKCQDIEAVIDREILSSKPFPLESIESEKDGVEEFDVALEPASEVTSIGEVKLSDEILKEVHASADFKTPETIETANISQQDSEMKSNKPEEASTVEPKLAEHENKIEARENVTAAKAESDDAEVEIQKVLGAEVECSSFEEINEENASPGVGETDTTASEEVVHEQRIYHDQEAKNIKEEVQNTSSVFIPSEESHENETATNQNTEDDVKAEEGKGFDAVCESRDQLEEINESKISPTEEVSAEVKMEEETDNVAEKLSDVEAVVDIQAAESLGEPTYPAEKADIDASIKLSAAEDPEEAIVSKSITSSRVLDVEEIHGTETSPTGRQTLTDREEDENKTVLETASKTDYEDVAESDIAPAVINEEGGYRKIDLGDVVAKASNISSDTETQVAAHIDDTPILDSEINKYQHREHQNVQEIHEADTSPNEGESDADGSINVFDVEESKSYIFVDEPKDQAVQDIHETGTSPTNQNEMSEIDPETREAPETINKEINQDSLVVSKDGIAPKQPTEAEKTQEEEKGFDPVPESKDHNFMESLECKTIPMKEVEEYGTKREFEIHGSEVDPILKVTNNVDEQLDKDGSMREDGNMREDESETHIENTIEAAQVTHEITSKELLTEEPQKVEIDNSLRETITLDNRSAEAPEPVSAVMGTASVSYEEEEKDEKYVDKEPIVENDGKGHENLMTETRSTKEVKSSEVILASPENKMGDYNKDETAIAKINNNENNDEDANMELKFHVPACEQNCIEESVDLTEQEAIPNASDFSYSKTSEEGLAAKREITVDEKQCDLTLDPAPIIPSVEKLVLTTAINQEAVGDVTESSDIPTKPQEEEKIALSQPQEQVSRKEYLNEENENKNAIASRDFQVLPADPTAPKQVELCEVEKPGEKSSESNEKLTQKDQAEVSSSEVLDISTEETEQATEKPNTEVEEKGLVEEEKTDEEEEDEHKKADSGSDAPVMVEASREIDVKTPHKKSHSILSGVGSKVKHSLAKVKKAITGKSSNQKTSSPKEDKKTEYVRLL